MQKVAFFLVIIGLNLFAFDSNFKSEFSQSNNKEDIQRELNTIKDYKELEGNLKKAIMFGDKKSMFWLGVVYYNGVKLKNGIFVPSRKKDAISLFKSAIKEGSLKAFSFLSIQYIQKQKVVALSEIVKIAQNSHLIALKDKDYFTSLLASLILDTELGDSEAIEIAMSWLYEAEKKRPTPKLEFILANMYNMLGNEEAAIMYLNKSCADESMREICGRYKNNPLQNKSNTCQNL